MSNHFTTTTTTTTSGRHPMDVLGLALIEFGTGFLYGFAITARWIVLFPMISAPILLALTAHGQGYPGAGLAIIAVQVVALFVWWFKHPASFHRWITDRAVARFLAWYRYDRRWVALLTACGLVVTDGGKVRVPRLRMITIGDGDDLVQVQMLPGHQPTDYSDRADQLAHAFGAHECRVRVVEPGVIELHLRTHDTLATPVDLPEVIDGPDWTKDAA